MAYTEDITTVKFLESLTLTNSPLAVREISGVTYYRLKLDLDKFTKYRVTMRVSVVGTTNSDVHFEGSLNDSSFSDLDGSAGPELALNTLGEKDTGWVTLATTFRTNNVRIRMMEKDGDGTADPVLRQIVLQFK